MKKKQTILITVLGISIVALGVGFAAFSTVLNISSSANVTPNSGDFSVVFSSSDENYVVDEVEAEVDNAGEAGTGTVTTTDGIIDNATNDKPKITNLSATFTKPGQKATYTFYVHNNGKYDAYLTNIVFNNVEGSSNIKTCTEGEGTTPEYVSDACDGIKYSITVDNEFADTTRVVEDKLLPIDEFKTVTVEIEYKSGSRRADGPFSVNFGSIELHYNTINSPVNGVPTENETYTVTGTILDDDGNPVNGGYAAVFSTKKVVEVGNNGTFKVTGLEPGKHEVYYLGSTNPTNLNKTEIKKQASIKGTFTTNDNEIIFSNGKKSSIQITNSNIVENLSKCKRATTLHNDGTHTFGNDPSTRTNVLQSGDALDCDVTGIGNYDERFYYVSDYYDTNTKTFNSDYATLIYYSNVTNGTTIDNINGYLYNESDRNYEGPETAKLQLPTTSQWPNIRLYKQERAIINEKGGNTAGGKSLPTAYSYINGSTVYAARLLTIKELEQSCNIVVGSKKRGELDNCTYLLENLLFSNSNYISRYFLENSLSNNNTHIWNVAADPQSFVTDCSAGGTNKYGVRPVIDMKKSDIDLTVR